MVVEDDVGVGGLVINDGVFAGGVGGEEFLEEVRRGGVGGDN